MNLYRQRPITVEAEQVTDENAAQIAYWRGGVIVEEIDPQDSSKKHLGVNIPTLNGNARASTGDFVVRRMNGVVEVMKALEFHSMYEPI